jgi:hypothetical protein
MTFLHRVSHLQRASAAVAVTCAAFFSGACTGSVNGENPGSGATGSGATGSGATGSGATGSGATGGKAASGGSGGSTGGSGQGGSAGSSGGAGGTGGSLGGTGGTGASGGTGPTSTGGVKLRLLTQAEYLASVRALFGNVSAQLDLPADFITPGFASLGASVVTVNTTAVDKYEVASRAVVAEVFADMARWQTLVGCQPQANLSDACVETFARSFGRRAFRRDLVDAEVTQWVEVARNAATLASSASQGLSTMTSGFLQSPNFLYRSETNAVDPGNGRLKYDGRSMAVRLAYFLTGGPPSPELLAAGESGQLDTAAGVASAAAPLLADQALVGRLTSFFLEYTQTELIMSVEKSPVMFPNFNDALRASMREGARLFLERIVLAPGADVRSFFNSDQTFADAALAPIYGVTPPASGFAQFTMGAGRAGAIGQAGILAAHSKPDHSSPTARGLFMLRAYLCTTPDPPPPGVNTDLVVDPTLNTRDRLEQHRADPKCAGCHAMFDPLGMALEHFDSIGRYRETEDGLAIDATGMLEDGTAFNGGAELGAALHGNAPATECLLRHFYRNVNGRDDDIYDQPQVDALMASLSARNYVFRDLVADFVVSDAFRSAPAVPLTGENQ